MFLAKLLTERPAVAAALVLWFFNQHCLRIWLGVNDERLLSLLHGNAVNSLC